MNDQNFENSLNENYLVLYYICSRRLSKLNVLTINKGWKVFVLPQFLHKKMKTGKISNFNQIFENSKSEF